MEFTITEAQAKQAIRYGMQLHHWVVSGDATSVSISGKVEYNDNYRQGYELNATFEFDQEQLTFYNPQTDKYYDCIGLALLMSRIDDIEYTFDEYGFFETDEPIY